MPSFDIVSKVQWAEVANALNQAEKELGQRFDFRGTETSIEKTDAGILVKSSSDERVKAALDVFQEKLVKRKVSLKFLEIEDPKPTPKGGAMILVKVKEGIESEPARKLIGGIKEAKLKVQSSIQEAQVRVTGKNKDDLQKAIALVRGLDLGIELSFVNFRN